MNRVVSFATLIALTFGVPTEKIGKHRIINGKNATDGEFPYQVSLLKCTGRHCWPSCGGTIISSKAVLTAAHCCDLKHTYRVGVGSTSEVITERQAIRATRFTKHEDYGKGPGPNDICIIHLKKSIKYSTNVQPAALPFPGSSPTGFAVVSGWGSTGSTFPDHLQKATLEVISINECEKFLKLPHLRDYQHRLEKNGANICTFDKDLVSTCVGDSGGPLAQNGVVIGVVSWGFHPCGYAPSVYTAVSHYIDWIYRHTPDLQGKKLLDTGNYSGAAKSGTLGKMVEHVILFFDVF